MVNASTQAIQVNETEQIRFKRFCNDIKSAEIKAYQLGVLALRVAQFAAQISTFWFFALSMHQVTSYDNTAQKMIVEGHQVVSSKYLLLLALSACIWGLSVFAADLFAQRLKNRIEAKLEAAIHSQLYRHQLALVRQYSSAFWRQLLLENISDIANYLAQYSIQQRLSAIAPALALLVIFPINYVVALTLLLTLPILPLFMILVGKGAAALHRKHFIALERLSDMFSDRLKALPLITVTGQHSQQSQRLDKASIIVNRNTMKVVSIAFLSSTVLDFFSTISIALVAVFIGFSMLGEINVGPDINLHTGLFMLLVSPLLFSELRLLGKYYHQKAKAEAASAHLTAVLDTRSTSAKVSGQRARSLGQHANQFNDTDSVPFTGFAWLNFQCDKPRLHASKLTLHSGDWVLLEGKSGAGKTALLETLIGFKEGSHALQGNIALFTQNTAFLDASVKQNLSLGRKDISSSQLLQALDEVELDFWYAKLRDGLDTPMGDCPPLSGGEAQRFALARVLLLQKDVVLLDEPTAHLTQEQHERLTQLIREKLHHKTVIWASHKSLPHAWFTQHWHIQAGKIEVSQCP